MISFVLHGGVTSRNTTSNDAFFRKFTDVPEKEEIKILMCNWAREREKWTEIFERDIELVKRQTHKKTMFTLLMDPGELNEKMQTHDVLYVTGGDAENIEPYYSRVKDLKNLLQNKVFIGSSMGAFMVAQNYVLSSDTQDQGVVHEGLGIIPLNILCHWNIENYKDKKINLLKEKSPNTPILTLDECQFANFIF